MLRVTVDGQLVVAVVATVGRCHMGVEELGLELGRAMWALGFCGGLHISPSNLVANRFLSTVHRCVNGREGHDYFPNSLQRVALIPWACFAQCLGMQRVCMGAGGWNRANGWAKSSMNRSRPRFFPQHRHVVRWAFTRSIVS